MELFGSIDTTHLCFKISILMRPQSDPVSESRCFFFFLIFFLYQELMPKPFYFFFSCVGCLFVVVVV